MIETRALPPSYRPSTSEDVPVFRPACANCEYLQIVIDVSLDQPVSRCTRWDAEVAAESYCDAWEPGAVPSWIKDDDAMEVEEDRSAELLEARRSIIETAEKRTTTTEVRATRSSDGQTVNVRGYAAMWDQEADGLPFREVIKRGAFAQSLDRGDDVFLLVNHDTDALPLARRSAGTLTLVEDEVGLLIDANLDLRSAAATDAAVALELGNADKMSFAFSVAEGGSTKSEDGVRELRTLDLFEVSIVTWPAYSGTSVGVRSASDDIAARWRFAQLRATR